MLEIDEKEPSSREMHCFIDIWPSSVGLPAEREIMHRQALFVNAISEEAEKFSKHRRSKSCCTTMSSSRATVHIQEGASDHTVVSLLASRNNASSISDSIRNTWINIAAAELDPQARENTKDALVQILFPKLKASTVLHWCGSGDLPALTVTGRAGQCLLKLHRMLTYSCWRGRR
jgi:hypothetical protein